MSAFEPRFLTDALPVVHGDGFYVHRHTSEKLFQGMAMSMF